MMNGRVRYWIFKIHPVPSGSPERDPELAACKSTQVDDPVAKNLLPNIECPISNDEWEDSVLDIQNSLFDINSSSYLFFIQLFSQLKIPGCQEHGRKRNEKVFGYNRNKSGAVAAEKTEIPVGGHGDNKHQF